jgi:cytochrome c-type biogenesis protein CcmE
LLLPLLACRESAPNKPDASPHVLGAPIRSEPPVFEYHQVDEIPARLRGKLVRVHGWVEPGSVWQRRDPAAIRFALVRGEGRVMVEYTAIPPEGFQERLEAIVSGTLSQDGTSVFADELLTQLPEGFDSLPVHAEAP